MENKEVILMHPITKYRKKHDLTVKTMAERLGVSRVFMSYLEHGHRKPSLDMAKRIEKITNGEVSRMDVLYPEEK